MITPQACPGQPPGWRKEFADSITDPAELLEILALDPSWLADAKRAASHFPLRVPRCFVARMAKGDVDDPLLKQVLPLRLELEEKPGYGLDPVGDLPAKQARGVLQKYTGRVLLIASGACAVNCRYCFRREFPYPVNVSASGAWEKAVALIAADSSINEVILSGGDPLTLGNTHLRTLTDQLERIDHVRSLRIHSRLPVVLPSRIDSGFLRWLEDSKLQSVLVIHANHANEFDQAVLEACHRLRDSGTAVFNQSVLLKGVNDSPTVLVALSQIAFSAGVIPYYLHMLDRIRGASHFEVTERRAIEIMTSVSEQLPGYLVPKLVREEEGALFKLPIQGIGFAQDVPQVAEHDVEPL